jgi:hypothetical protein
MQDVGDAWDEIVMPEEHPRLIYLFIRSVTLENLSPLFFRAHIQWRDPAWDIDCGLCFKGGQTSLAWTEEEAAILQEHFVSAPRSQLMQLLPRRGYQAMKCYVRDHKLGLSRKAMREPDVPTLVCLEDWTIMQEYGITEQELLSVRNAKLIEWVCPQQL